MQQPEPSVTRPMRRAALAVTGVCALVGGLAVGTSPAFAATDSDFSSLSSDFASGADDIYLGANISQSNGTLTLGPETAGTASATTLHLNGNSLTVQAIELTSNQGGTLTPSNLIVTGSGTLTVAQTDTSHPAIEVTGGSSLIVSGGSVTASVPMASTAAAIGGGPSMGSQALQSAGALTFNGNAVVHATGGASGAAIGGGAGATAAGGITIGGSAQVTATATGTGAAIGDGNGAAGASILIANQARVFAYQTGTGSTAAGIGGGASPSGQTAGSITVGDDAQLTASSTGAGAAIGGGYHGDGGQITATGYAQMTATGAEAAIGDGEHSTGGGTSVNLSGQGVVVAAHGGTDSFGNASSSGGAGIGGGFTAYGNDSLTVAGGATLTATSANGPGIGGLANTVGMSVSVGNATVTATGGASGAGIGAGSPSSIGATVGIANGGTVTASGGSTAIGGSTAARFGSLSNDGSLVVPSGTLTIPSGATATSSGSFVNAGTTTISGSLSNTGTITNIGTINGSGTLDNQGTVLQNGTLSTSSITGNNFDVNYDPQAGTASTGEQRVYAPSVSAAGLPLPSATPSASGTFTGWNAATDGSGATLRSGSSIVSDFGASSSSDGRPVTVRAYAQYQLTPVLPSGSSLAQGVVGTGYSATVAVTSGTAPITYSYSGSLPAGLTLSPSTGAISGTPTTMGSFTLHVTATNALSSATHDYTIQIVPTPIVLSIPTTAKGTTWYLAGSTASLRITGLQTNETYTVTIGGRTAATGKASSNSAFTAKVGIPRTIGDGSQTVSVSGGDHVSAGTATILTASVSKSLGLKLSAKKIKHGKKLTVTVSKLYPGEKVTIVFAGKHAKTAVKTASSKGVATVAVSSLAKGGYTVRITGAGTSRKASAKLTVS